MGIAKLRSIGGEDKITVQSKFQGSGKAGPVDLGNHRYLGIADGQLSFPGGAIKQITNAPTGRLYILQHLEVYTR